MAAEQIRLNSGDDCSSAARRAADVLLQGGLVIFPTETVYGVAAAATPDALRRLREVKGRSVEQALTVHIGRKEDAAEYVSRLTGLARRLIRKAWPGPVTLILPVADPLSVPVAARLNPEALHAVFHRQTVGLRCPDERFASEFLSLAAITVVASSANRAGHPPPSTFEQAMVAIGNDVDLCVDTGPTRYNKPSTIVRIERHAPVVIREGVLTTGTIARMSTLRLLFVCTGNTCRSPMAAGLTRKLLAERWECTVEELAQRGAIISSAGTSGGGGGAADQAVRTMLAHGIDLRDHVSTPLTADQVCQADYTFAMTAAHREAILSMEPAAEERVLLLLSDRDVADPFGGSIDDYERCAEVLEQGLRARLEELDL